MPYEISVVCNVTSTVFPRSCLGSVEKVLFKRVVFLFFFSWADVSMQEAAGKTRRAPLSNLPSGSVGSGCV